MEKVSSNIQLGYISSEVHPLSPRLCACLGGALPGLKPNESQIVLGI